MKTEELIARLARDGGSVDVLAPVPSRLASWSLSAAVVTAIAASINGVRPDLMSKLADPRFLVSAAAVIALTVGAAAGAIAWSVPGGARSRLTGAVPLLALGAWGAALALTLVAGGAVIGQLVQEPAHPSCAYQVVLVGSVPAVLLWRDVRRAAPLEPRWTAACIAAAAFGAGAVSAALTCPIDRAAHQVWWHVAPVVVLALAGAAMPPSLSSRLAR